MKWVAFFLCIFLLSGVLAQGDWSGLEFDDGGDLPQEDTGSVDSSYTEDYTQDTSEEVYDEYDEELADALAESLVDESPVFVEDSSLPQVQRPISSEITGEKTSEYYQALWVAGIGGFLVIVFIFFFFKKPQDHWKTPTPKK